jgi:hypothetical protein
MAKSVDIVLILELLQASEYLFGITMSGNEVYCIISNL